MHWFVTGGTGQIGHKLVRHLLQDGEQVTGLTTSTARAEALKKQGARAIVGQMDEPGTWKQLVADADAIIHLAQKHADRFGARQMASIAKADNACVHALLENAGDRCQAFVYSSGALIYGDCPEPIREEDPFLCPPAVRAKLEHEALAERLGRERGIRVISARLGQVYGDGPGFFEKYFIEPAGKGSTVRYLGDGANIFSYIHNEDAAGAYVHLVRNSKFQGPVNVGSLEPRTGRWMAEEVSKHFGSKPPRSLPRLMVRLVMGWGFGGLVCLDHAMSSERLVSDGFVHKYPNTADGVKAACDAWKNGHP